MGGSSSFYKRSCFLNENSYEEEIDGDETMIGYFGVSHYEFS